MSIRFTRRLASLAVGALLVAAVTACGGSAASPTAAPPTSAPAATAVPPAATATAAPAAASDAGAPTTAPASSGDVQTIKLVIVPDKSEARYRVREQLAGVSLPSDAIGKTNAITGQIVGKTDGTILSDQSEFVVDVRTLTSDQAMRDGFIQRSTLQSSQYPTVKFVPTSAPGLPLTPPASGPATFDLIGNLTVRDVTKPTTWKASCTLDSSQTVGTCSATTTFTFADFGLEQPRVARVLSIEDNITLEVDLTLQRENQ